MYGFDLLHELSGSIRQPAVCHSAIYDNNKIIEWGEVTKVGVVTCENLGHPCQGTLFPYVTGAA